MAEEAAAKKVEAEEGQSRGAKPILLYGVILFNIIVMACVVYMFWAGRKKEAQNPGIDAVVAGEQEAQAEQKDMQEEITGQMVPMEMFLVNLSGANGRKLLKVLMELEVEGPQVQTEIEKRKPQIRDIIITLLSSKTYEQVSSKEGKDYLRDEIRETVNSFLTRGKIKRVLFTEFIYQ